MLTLGRQIMDFVDAEELHGVHWERSSDEWNDEAEAALNEFLVDKLETAVRSVVRDVLHEELGLG